MNHPTTATSIPIIKDSELRLTKMRGRLEGMFHELHTIHAVVVVSAETLTAQRSDFDPEVGRILTRCGADKLRGQLRSLSNIIEQLGGRTEYSDDPDEFDAEVLLHTGDEND